MTSDEFEQIMCAINQMKQVNIGNYGYMVKTSSVLTILQSHIQPYEDRKRYSIKDKDNGSYQVWWTERTK